MPSRQTSRKAVPTEGSAAGQDCAHSSIIKVAGNLRNLELTGVKTLSVLGSLWKKLCQDESNDYCTESTAPAPPLNANKL